MQFKDKASIIIEQQIEDGYGGFESVEELYGEIKVTTAPFKVEVGEIITIPNPTASVKFFTNSKLDEDMFFYISYNGKKYRKVLYVDYGKCAMIIGERI